MRANTRDTMIKRFNTEDVNRERKGGTLTPGIPGQTQEANDDEYFF